MRQKRAKAYKRLMALYVQTFNFRSPFQVLVSNDILLAPAVQALDIVKGLGTCVQGEIKPMMTQCCMEALYALGKPAQQTTNLAKTFERRRCNHREAIPPDECLKDVIGTTNKHRYILATQSTPLRTSLEPIPGLPIVHFNAGGVLVLSPPSTATVRAKNTVEEGRRLEGAKVLEGVRDGGNVVGAASSSTSASASASAVNGARREAKATKSTVKVKGVNPLSMKKKKKVTVVAPGEKGAGKRKREGAEDEAEGEAEAEAGDAVAGGADASASTPMPEDGRKKKKKRKRKNKSEVAMAIGELNAMNEGEGGDSGDDGAGSDDE